MIEYLPNLCRDYSRQSETNHMRRGNNVLIAHPQIDQQISFHPLKNSR